MRSSTLAAVATALAAQLAALVYYNAHPLYFRHSIFHRATWLFARDAALGCPKPPFEKSLEIPYPEAIPGDSAMDHRSVTKLVFNMAAFEVSERSVLISSLAALLGGRDNT
jgi:hypothetical protein